ncbi:PREDICTED: uncharacterized protein LOC108571047 [Habropoda laboriosa]|nr:PREDICTED: uncharacterized protein LOC108571047 [Habropoda laboriosa]
MLGKSMQQAEKRLLNLEHKLNTQPDIKDEYTTFLEEYESLGHMSEITDKEQLDTAYYLPHHAVYKASSTTTKLRVVFDGSAKTTSGLSLNNVQFVGPVVQNDLISILLRFRKHRYVISADIAKMYRQIWVREQDRKFQRILWRKNRNETIKAYSLNTVTYDTASAPYLATKVLQHNGKRHQETYPLASRVIVHDFYVDDLLTGTDSISDTIQLKTELDNILRSSGFELRKWASNETSILSPQIVDSKQLQIVPDTAAKTLGLCWNFDQDILTFSVKNSANPRITKRTILSDISQIFDPLGLIGPATIQAKIILQELWQLRVSWDESLPQHLHSQWNTFREELMQINNIKIPRYALTTDRKRIELHAFSDASERAYGACVYLRTLDNKNRWSTDLLCAKSKVAPLKVISLPRLELCGAQLLAQLVKRVRSSIDIACDEHYWCDSTIVLAWISSPSKQWKTFVANRVSEIQRLLPGKWSHVASSENPADIISRGISPSSLINNKHWWNGPYWLLKHLPQPCLDIHNQLSTESVAQESRISCVVTPNEIKRLQAGQTVARTSPLIALNPVLDKTGLLRVGGRLINAKLSFDYKHPIILPANHHITKLILLREHSQTRQSELDYAGPFLIKEKTRSKTTLKAYLCIFVCFSTKAVHLELAIDMTSQSFLNCLKRFISRRGLCHTIFSDNGTNFVGARNELLDLSKLLTDKEHHQRVKKFLSENNIQWNLIPPRAPHFGGLWEGAVKSTKYHLKRVIGETRLTYEELYTILTQIEACLNSRPLSPLSDDPTDLSPLTPGHFLIGESLTTFSQPDLNHIKENRLSRYQHLQRMLQHFWQRWQAEYLHQLQQRNKWRKNSHATFGPGTLVLIKDDNLPPLKWRLGRIVELHPGTDNITRVVSIKSAEGLVKRPLTKICVLPMDQEIEIPPDK